MYKTQHGSRPRSAYSPNMFSLWLRFVCKHKGRVVNRSWSWGTRALRQRSRCRIRDVSGHMYARCNLGQVSSAGATVPETTRRVLLVEGFLKHEMNELCLRRRTRLGSLLWTRPQTVCFKLMIIVEMRCVALDSCSLVNT